MLKHVQSPNRSSSSLGRRCDSSPSSPSVRTPLSSIKSRSSTLHSSSPKREILTPTSPTTSSTTSGSSITCHAPRRRTRRGIERIEDTRSLSSSMSCSSEEDLDTSISSNESSSSSLHQKDFPTTQENEETTNTKTTVRIWVRCLLQEMEYKTLSITYLTSCRDVVHRLLSKFKMKHRDPNLFYLAMEVTATNKGCVVKTCLTLDDEARPAQLVACHPRGESKLALKMRHGGVVRVYDGALVKGSQYKSLLVSDKTNCLQLLHLVLSLNNVHDNINNYSLFETRKDGTERKLQAEERPIKVIDKWRTQNEAHIVVRLTPQPPQSAHQAHARVTPIPTLRSALTNHKTKPNNQSNNKDNSHQNNQTPKCQCRNKNYHKDSSSCNHSTKDNSIYNSQNILSNSSLDSAYSSSLNNFSPSTTITISSNGLTTVQNTSSLSLSNSDDKPSEYGDEPPSPPLRLPRRGVIANSDIVIRRQLPWTGSGDLVETAVDDDDSLTDINTSKTQSYNDYENYFYI